MSSCFLSILGKQQFVNVKFKTTARFAESNNPRGPWRVSNWIPSICMNVNRCMNVAALLSTAVSSRILQDVSQIRSSAFHSKLLTSLTCHNRKTPSRFYLCFSLLPWPLFLSWGQKTCSRFNGGKVVSWKKIKLQLPLCKLNFRVWNPETGTCLSLNFSNKLLFYSLSSYRKVSITSPIMVSNVFRNPWSQLTSQNVLRSSSSTLSFWKVTGIFVSHIFVLRCLGHHGKSIPTQAIHNHDIFGIW